MPKVSVLCSNGENDEMRSGLPTKKIGMAKDNLNQIQDKVNLEIQTARLFVTGTGSGTTKSAIAGKSP